MTELSRPRLTACILIMMTLLLSAGSVPPVRAAATPKPAVRLTGGEKCFTETDKCLHGVFLGYWQSHGGLAAFGFAITDELSEDGRTVQYTERARFEFHPEFRDTSNEVLLSLLGNQRASNRTDAPF